MNIEELNKTIYQAGCRADNTLVEKNNKYNPGPDKLEHFKVDETSKTEQIKSLLSYAKKHWINLHGMAQHADSAEPYRMDEWTESLDDMVNYMHLLECLLVDYKESSGV